MHTVASSGIVDATREDAMKAKSGDRLIIRPHHLGEAGHDAEILEVLGPAGDPPFRVRWEDDGREALIFPGTDAWVEHLATEGGKTRRRRIPAPRHARRTTA
jgi:hypothetical protein